MASPRQQPDRKRSFAPRRGFDDRLWPIYGIIGLLSASAVMIVLEYSEFPAAESLVWDDPALLSSGWFRLASVGVFVIAAMAAVHLARRWMNRRVLFCVLFGMLVHLWGGIYLRDQMILLWTRLDSSRQEELAALPDPVTVPDYHWEAIERAEVRQSFEEPVPTSAADEGRVAPVERQPVDYETRLEIPEPSPTLPAEPATPPALDPDRPDRPPPDDPAELARLDLARQHFIDRPEPPSQPLPLPKLPARPKTESAPLEVPVEAARRRQARASIPDRPAERDDSLSPAQAARSGPARRTSASDPILVESALAGIPKNLSEARMVPTTDLAVPRTLTARPQPPSAEVDFEPGLTVRRESVPSVRGAAPATPSSDPAESILPSLPSRRTGSRPALATTAGSLSIRRAEFGSPPLPVARPAGGLDQKSGGAGKRDAPAKRDGPRVPAPETGSAESDGGPIARVQRLDFAAPLSRTGMGGTGTPTSSGASAGTSISRGPRRGGSQLAAAASTRLSIPRGDLRPVIRSRAVIAAPGPFGQRNPRDRLREALNHGGTPATERAVELGLEYFARHQFAAGHWSLDRPAEPNPNATSAVMNADTASTGLALLSFLGAGYTHREGKHRETVARGLAWLRANQHADGRLYGTNTDRDKFARMYGHGIAAIAVCEAYGMTRDEELRATAENAVRFILASQHPERGGWRYIPGEESDTSVSGWHLMALKSAQMAGLHVPAEALENVSHWLKTASTPDGSQYAYNPYAPDNDAQRQGRRASLAMTAEGLLMRFYLGWDGENPAAIAGADYLSENLPQLGRPDWPLRNTYYWYYATQVMFQMQGERWTAWNDRLRPLLVQGQQLEGPLAGSWDPWAPVPDRWAGPGGRHYITALNLLMLEVYYRHLPLFRTLNDGG